MATDALPDHWYEYDFPLTNRGPTPSQANYTREDGAASEGVSWLIEFFAQILGESHTDVRFWYENNSPENRTDDIILGHPGDKLYLPDVVPFELRNPTSAMLKYERYAKRSSILKKFEENSPANITYFQKGPISSA